MIAPTLAPTTAAYSNPERVGIGFADLAAV
jgi:hypothetical protein